MYYISIDPSDSNKLIYYCRNCGNKDSNVSIENVIVSKLELKKSEQEFSHIINKFLCPNADCLTNKEDKPREIIYIRYDDINMKYVYLCSTCDTVWKTEDQT